VAAKNTPKYNLINGAVDIDGQPVNPSTDGGKTDGAGIAIDMSRYAMIGANPSFSSVTVTNKTDLGGNTTINGNLTVTGNTTLAATSANSVSATSVTSPTISGTNITASAAIRANNLSANTISANTFTGAMSKKLTWGSGKFTADTVNGYNGSADRTITVPTELSHLTYKTLTIKDASGTTVGTYDPGANSTQTIVIPTGGGGGGKSPLTINYGNIYTGTKDTSYNTTAAKTITIPDSLSNVSNGNAVDSSPTNTSGKITIKKNLEVSGTVTATGAIYSSDRNLKENIFDISENEFERVGFVKYKTYNFKGEDNKMYGVIAQDLQDAGLGEMVYSRDDGTLAVDYTSLMILQLARLKRDNENMLTHIAWLERRIEKLEGNNNE
jgi:hypothetical protein